MIPDESSVARTILPNGLTVLVQTDHSTPVVAIVTYVKAGYFDERDDEVGISHVLEHMYFKGTATRTVGEIAKQTKAAGGYLNANTIYDNTTYYTVLPSGALRTGLEIQSDAFANSTIDAGELQKELEVIIQEAKRKNDHPAALATETLFDLLHDRHRIRRWRIGREPELRALTRERVLEFYRNFYRPGNTILAISGELDTAAALASVSELYGSLPAGAPVRHQGPAEPEHRGLRYRELSGDVAQSQFLAGWRTPGALHPDTPALDCVAALLGSGRASRLYRSVRERRLAASISCANHTPIELGIFVAHGEGEPAKTVAAIRSTWNEIISIGASDIHAGELGRIRSVFDSRWTRRLETAQGRASYLAEWEAVGGWKLGEEYRAAFLATDAAGVARVAKQYLTADQAGLLVYRPESSLRIAPDAKAMEGLVRSGARSIPGPTRAATPNEPTRRLKPASVDLEREEAGVLVFRTRSGVPILVHPKRGAAISYMGAHTLGGAIDDPERLAGLTLLGTRTMLKGAKSRNAEEIAEQTESLGASLGASTGSDGFGWSMSVPTVNFAAAAELFGDLIVNSSFPAGALDTERSVALSNLALLRDDMVRYPVHLATTAAFAGHPYGVPASGSEESLTAVSREELLGWHARRVLESPMAIGVVGDLDPSRAAGIIASAVEAVRFRTAGSVPAPIWPRERRSASELRDKAQTALALAFPGPSRGDAARYAGHFLTTIASGLGGRFFEELRDRRSLAYTVHLSLRALALGGLFVAYIATSPEKEIIAREALLSEFARLQESRATEEELVRSREYMIGSHAIARESGAALLGEMLDAWLFGEGLNELLEHDAMVRAVTAEQIRELADRCFDPAVVVEGIVRGATSRLSR